LTHGSILPVAAITSFHAFGSFATMPWVTMFYMDIASLVFMVVILVAVVKVTVDRRNKKRRRQERWDNT
jgi:heme exporter protein D